MTEQNSPENETGISEQRSYWDSVAAAFDDEPDHGLKDPDVRSAWSDLLARWLPPGRGNVLDAGCGTGTLSVLIAAMGHRVTGIDVASAMLERARAKVIRSGVAIDFQGLDAATPELPPHTFDAVVCRHVLWTLPEPAQVLARWASLLRPAGRLLLIEGFWHTGSGLHAAEVIAALPASLTLVVVEDLAREPVYWGKGVGDERYLVVAELVDANSKNK